MGKHGGVRKGAGRPKKEQSEELKTNVFKAIAKVYGGNLEFWVDTAKKSKEDFRCRQLLVNYGYGKPIEYVDHTTNGENIPSVIEIIEYKKDK